MFKGNPGIKVPSFSLSLSLSLSLLCLSASAVIGSFSKYGEIPPVDFPRQDIGDAPSSREGRLGDFTKDQIMKIRLHIVNKSRAGQNVFSKDVCKYAGELMGRVITLKKFKKMRSVLGVLFDSVVGAHSAKLSRHVRSLRYQFVERRRAASLRESHLRPIRVYSDETYIHTNYASKNSWVLNPKAWLETVTYEASEKMKAGEEVPDIPDTSGLAGKRGVHVRKPRSGRGQLGVVVNALYALPDNLSQVCKDHIESNKLPYAGAVNGCLKIWPAAQSTGTCPVRIQADQRIYSISPVYVLILQPIRHRRLSR